MSNPVRRELRPLLALLMAAATGVATASVPKIAMFVGLSIFFWGLYKTIRTRNAYGTAHLFAGFIVGAEVYFRMSGTGLPWEFGKIAVTTLLLVALMVERRKKAIPILFLLYLIVMLPGVFVPDWSSLKAFKKEFMFTFFGQIVLVVSVFYFYKRKFGEEELLNFGRWILYGVAMMSALIFLKTPDYSTIHFGGGSNFAATGGFGPNQVAAIFGLGIVLMGYFLLLHRRVFVWLWLDLALLFVFVFQAMISFSRGGLFAAVMALGFAVASLYFTSPARAVSLLRIGIVKLMLLVVVLGGAYVKINDITGGALAKRYLNRDEYGMQIKEDYSTKRADIIRDDLNTFEKFPVIGTGIGGGRAYRAEQTGISAAHVEFSRMLAEHGILGLLALLIIFFYPIYLFFRTKDLVTRFTLVAFTGYGLLTMSHNALRLALPSFMYGAGFIAVLWRYKKTRGVRHGSLSGQ